MSYILDALNKSEAERARRSAPGLDAIHRPPSLPSRGRHIWPWIVSGLVIGNLALAAAWFFWTSPRAPAIVAQTAPQTLSPAPAPSNIAAAGPATPSPQPEARQTPESQTTAPASSAGQLGESEVLVTPTRQTLAAQPAEAAPEAMPISALPPDVRAALPPLAFSSHIYADEPSFRVVNINGHRFQQGDYITRDLQLLAITEEGAVLTFKGYQFSLSVLDEWRGAP